MDRDYKSGGSVITERLYIDVKQDLKKRKKKKEKKKGLSSIINQVLHKPPEDRKINGQ